MKRITHVEGISAAVGPYSFGVIANGFLYTAGQVGQTAEGKLIEGGVESQARQAMNNLGLILGSAALGFGNVVKTTIYLTDVEDFGPVNAVYAEHFEEGAYPARETVVVAGLPLGAAVEISMVAALPENA